jgi:hypothetical protein
MKDSKHIKRAPHDTEQHLLQKEQLSDSDNCLKTMKQIATLIEEVSAFSALFGPWTILECGLLASFAFLFTSF